MTIEVALLPRDLPEDLSRRTVVVFDVLRATTSMIAALAAGVGEIRIFGDVESARAAAAKHVGPRLLCGEISCLPPPGFDLGNSPGAFSNAAHGGRVMFMATTNGTGALLAAQSARQILVGALVNAAAVARHLAHSPSDAVLLCAGTNGRVAAEDLLGAGAVLHELSAIGAATADSDEALIALELFRRHRDDLPAALRRTRGGRNVIAAGLQGDIDFSTRVNVFNLVGVARGSPLVVTSLQSH